jgi:hypothetical protein
MDNPLRKPNTNQRNMPFTVCCVVGDLEDVAEYEEIGVVRTFCVGQGVPFQVRLFDSARYEEDSLQVRHLPAFHIYDKKRTCQSTFYAEDNPIVRIKTEIVRTQEAVEAAAREREAWTQRWRAVTGLFVPRQKIAHN